MKVFMQDTGMWTLPTVPPQTATEKVEKNEQTETKEIKSLGTSLLGASFFTAPLIFGQTLPRLPTFTTTHSVGIRDTRRLNTRRGTGEPCILRTEYCSFTSLPMRLPAPRKLCFLQPYVFPTSHSKVDHKRKGQVEGKTTIMCDLPFALIIIC